MAVDRTAGGSAHIVRQWVGGTPEEVVYEVVAWAFGRPVHTWEGERSGSVKAQDFYREDRMAERTGSAEVGWAERLEGPSV